jgi:HPt (histidine-containing phosphotransfer) domain-containing protein
VRVISVTEEGMAPGQRSRGAREVVEMAEKRDTGPSGKRTPLKSPGFIIEDEAIFNRGAPVERLDGDVAFLDELVANFTHELPVMVDAVGNAVRQEDPGEIDRTAHTLKGAAANLAAERLRARPTQSSRQRRPCSRIVSMSCRVIWKRNITGLPCCFRAESAPRHRTGV